MNLKKLPGNQLKLWLYLKKELIELYSVAALLLDPQGVIEELQAFLSRIKVD